MRFDEEGDVEVNDSYFFAQLMIWVVGVYLAVFFFFFYMKACIKSILVSVISQHTVS